MAEKLFQRLHPGTAAAAGKYGQPRHERRCTSLDTDNLLESHRIMARAWARSTSDPRAAFTATGHLMKMIKLAAPPSEIADRLHRYHDEDLKRELVNGEIDNCDDDACVGSGPTLDDCRAVMDAWTRAEYVQFLFRPLGFSKPSNAMLHTLQLQG
jgi:hypothetical protein